MPGSILKLYKRFRGGSVTVSASNEEDRISGKTTTITWRIWDAHKYRKTSKREE